MTAHPITHPETDYSNLVDVLRWRAAHEPGKLAYTFLLDGEHEQGSLTYGTLDQEAKSIAAMLQSICIPGDRVLLLYPSGLEFICAFLGCLYAGVLAVPAALPRKTQHLSRLETIIADTQASIALTTSQFIDLPNQFSDKLLFASLRWLATNISNNSCELSWQKPNLHESTLAFLQYTSGSTGHPKGVMVSHGNLIHNQQILKAASGDISEAIYVNWLPLFHDMGLIGNVLQALYIGKPCILMSPEAFLQKPIRWLNAISKYRATTSGGPNLAYELCIQRITQDQLANLDLSYWSAAFNGAEPIRAETLERFSTKFKSCGFRSESFFPCYGMAEATLIITGGPKGQHFTICPIAEKSIEQNQVHVAANETYKIKSIVGCGQVLLDQKVLIVDPKTSILCQPDQVGEIWVSGPSVAQGYWNKESDTEITFCNYLTDTSEGPFLRTGDLGFMREGQLFITGRLKDLVIILGRNYYPQDIEAIVEKSHSSLRLGGGAVFSIEIDNREKLVILQEVERNYFRDPNADEVIGAIRHAVNEQYGLPIHTVVLLKTTSLPKTSSGKVQRQSCRTRFLTGNLEIVADWRKMQ